MSFPVDFPKPAFSTLTGLLSTEKPSADLIALAVYDLAGYGLGLYFGDVKYPIGLDLGKILEIATSPEFAHAKQAIERFVTLIASGTSRWRALLTVLFEYGPSVVALIKKLL